ncbi:MAG: hypothetical protein H6R15_55 [Proteobacteria bacterium]|nr:hypothetical protein [Pseudomonadota bacterium]
MAGSYGPTQVIRHKTFANPKIRKIGKHSRIHNIPIDHIL